MIQKLAMLAVVIVAGAVFSVFSFLSDYTLVDEQAGSVINNPVGFLMKYMDNDRRTVRFRADLVFDGAQKIDFSSDKNIDSVYVDYKNNALGRFIVNGLNFRSLEESRIEFVDYVGGIQITDKLSLSGSAKRVRTDGHTLTKDNFIQVSGKDVDFSKILLSRLGAQSMTLDNVSGAVELTIDNTTAVIPLSNKRLSVSYFDGDVQYYPDRVVLEGYGRLESDVFRAPN